MAWRGLAPLSCGTIAGAHWMPASAGMTMRARPTDRLDAGLHRHDDECAAHRPAGCRLPMA